MWYVLGWGAGGREQVEQGTGCRGCREQRGTGKGDSGSECMSEGCLLICDMCRKSREQLEQGEQEAGSRRSGTRGWGTGSWETKGRGLGSSQEPGVAGSWGTRKLGRGSIDTGSAGGQGEQAAERGGAVIAGKQGKQGAGKQGEQEAVRSVSRGARNIYHTSNPNGALGR